MTATMKQITVGAYQKSFDYFTDGFWGLCGVHENFRMEFNGANVPKSPEKWGTGWMDIETEAQKQVFGSLVLMPYYIDPESPNAPALPIFGLNSVEYKSRTGALHFKIERIKIDDPKKRNPWVFTVFPGDWGDNSLMAFKKTFENAGWNKQK